MSNHPNTFKASPIRIVVHSNKKEVFAAVRQQKIQKKPISYSFFLLLFKSNLLFSHLIYKWKRFITWKQKLIKHKYLFNDKIMLNFPIYLSVRQFWQSIFFSYVRFLKMGFCLAELVLTRETLQATNRANKMVLTEWIYLRDCCEGVRNKKFK